MAEKWQELTDVDFSLQKVEGGHFYFEDPERRKRLLADLAGKCLENRTK